MASTELTDLERNKVIDLIKNEDIDGIIQFNKNKRIYWCDLTYKLLENISKNIIKSGLKQVYSPCCGNGIVEWIIKIKLKQLKHDIEIIGIEIKETGYIYDELIMKTTGIKILFYNQKKTLWDERDDETDRNMGIEPKNLEYGYEYIENIFEYDKFILLCIWPSNPTTFIKYLKLYTNNRNEGMIIYIIDDYPNEKFVPKGWNFSHKKINYNDFYLYTPLVPSKFCYKLRLN